MGAAFFFPEQRLSKTVMRRMGIVARTPKKTVEFFSASTRYSCRTNNQLE
jgi:hypothetical protein